MSSPQSRDWVKLLSVRNELSKIDNKVLGWKHRPLVVQLIDAIANHDRATLDIADAMNDPLGIGQAGENDQDEDRSIAYRQVVFAVLNLGRANDAYHDRHFFTGVGVEPEKHAADLQSDFEQHLKLARESLLAFHDYLERE